MSIELKRLKADEIPALRRRAVDAQTLAQAAAIVDDVEQRGEAAVREHAERLGDLESGAPLYHTRAELTQALETIAPDQRALLERTAGRIRTFAEAQRRCIAPLEVEIAGGRAGHIIIPVKAAGCYAPGGRYPLPSSVLMTAITAKVAYVKNVWVASPKPTPVTLAAAAAAGADGLLAVGGAQAIAAMAFGVGEVPGCDVVVGPGNRWVTAAKQLVSGQVSIDMLAGPSELVTVADDSANAVLVAADLLAQAEHDVDALPILVSTQEDVVRNVERELKRQLKDLPTAETAMAALKNAFAVVVPDIEAAVAVTERIAPEHLQIHVRDAEPVSRKFWRYGGMFVGENSAEVLGDYGAGPNHVLPTGGTARSTAGLSVMTFLCLRTWMTIDSPKAAEQVIKDAASLGRIEGLEAHARAADLRLPK